MPKFQKGQSGNPGGRPRTPPEIKEALNQVTPIALATLQAIMMDKRADDEDRIKAAAHLLDRALGKPMTSLEQSKANEPPQRQIYKHPSRMSISELLTALKNNEPSGKLIEIEDE